MWPVAALNTLSEVLTGTERVLGTPLPAAYRIAISQIAWVYVLVLPFQLYTLLKWITIPGTIGKNLNGISYLTRGRLITSRQLPRILSLVLLPSVKKLKIRSATM